MADAVVFVIRAKDEFDKTLKRLEHEVQGTGKASKEAAAQGKDAFDRFEKKMGGLSRVATATAQKIQSGFSKAFRAVGTAAKVGFAAIVAGSAAVATGLGASVKAAASFQKAMHEVWTLTDWNRDQLHDMSRQALEFSTQFAESPDVIAQAWYSLISGSRRGRGEMDLLSNTISLADAGLASVADSMSLMTSFLGSFAWGNEKSAKAADLLFTTIKEGQTRMDWLIQYGPTMFSQLRAAGVGVETGLAAFATLTASMGEKMNPAAVTAMTNAIQQIYARQITKDTPPWLANLLKLIKQQPFEQAIGTIKKFLDQFETQQQRFEKATLIGGEKRAGRAIITLVQNYDLLQQKLKAFSNTQGAAAEAAAKMRETLEYQYRRAKTAIEALGKSVGEVLVPPLTRVADKIADWAAELAKIDFSKVWESFMNADDATKEVDDLVNYLKTQLTSALDPTTLFGSFFSFIGEMISGVAKIIWIPIETEAEIMFNRLMARVKQMAFDIIADIAEELRTTRLGARLGITDETVAGFRMRAATAATEANAEWGAQGFRTALRRTEAEEQRSQALQDLKVTFSKGVDDLGKKMDAFTKGARERFEAIAEVQAREARAALTGPATSANTPAALAMAGGLSFVDMARGLAAGQAEDITQARQEQTERLSESIIEFGGKVYGFSGKELEVLENTATSIEQIAARQDELETRLEAIRVTSETLRETSGRRSYAPSPA